MSTRRCLPYVLLAPLALLAFCLAPARAREKPFRLMLTSFDPFGGSARNASQEVGELVARELRGRAREVVVCNLPVVYDQAAARALECVERFRPDAVVSLGEAGCGVLVETGATNWDGTPELADNLGQLRAGAPIVPGAPARVGFNFPVQAMFCALDAAEPAVEVSTSPGAFVCNNLSYHLGLELGRRGVPFTFIHVPHSGCEAPAAPEVSRVIARMLEGAIAELAAPPAPSPWPHPGNRLSLPATRAQAEAFLAELRARPASRCEIRLTERLVSRF